LAEHSRLLDQIAIQQHGIAGYVLMCRAGTAAYQRLRLIWPQAVKLVVICGPGNNGGDGFVIAEQAHRQGLDVRLMVIGDEHRIRGDAGLAYKDFKKTGLSAQPFDQQALQSSHVIVDALFGTGLDREVSGPAKAVIESINTSGNPVLAVDLPSGLHADRGVVLGTCIRAAATISFIARKQGCFTAQGPALCGAMYFDDLAVPAEVYRDVRPSAWLNAWRQPLYKVNRRPAHGHKGMFGHVLVIGGNKGMAGAAVMAAMASARVGAGLVSVATHGEHANILNSHYPQLMIHAVENAQSLLPLLARATVVALGPGLGRDAWAQQLFRQVIAHRRVKVVDADGLHGLSVQNHKRDDWVLTPHPGEAGRLLGCDSHAVESDRFSACRTITEKFGGICLLKGVGSLIYGAQAGMTINTSGNPGMATAGMGDCLTGIVAGLLAQGLKPYDAACFGAGLHGAAADVVAAQDGECGMTAWDLIPVLQRLINGKNTL